MSGRIFGLNNYSLLKARKRTQHRKKRREHSLLVEESYIAMLLLVVNRHHHKVFTWIPHFVCLRQWFSVFNMWTWLKWIGYVLKMGFYFLYGAYHSLPFVIKHKQIDNFSSTQGKPSQFRLLAFFVTQFCPTVI